MKARTKPSAVYGHVCSQCGGRTYVCAVQGNAPRAALRVRVRHAEGCRLLTAWMRMYPALYDMRLPEEAIVG